MKLILTQFAVIWALLAPVTPSFCAVPDTEVRPPTLDLEGRFWIYRNGLAHPPMPFTPYGWMSDITNVSQLIQIDLDYSDNPNLVFKATGLPERERCIHLKINWGDATWASVAFISGPDKPPWWGDTDSARYYNLAGLTRKKLVFFARGEHGGEAVKIQLGALSGKPYGDSLKKPFISQEMTLTQDWTRHEIDLKNIPNSELQRICNGFGVLLERADQSGSPDTTQLYLDDIYLE